MLIKNRLLLAHDQSPFLTPEEVDSITRFTASESWARKFAGENGWKSKVLHGTAGSVDIDAIDDDIAILRRKIAQYQPKDVYNMDETGLYFKCLPSRSYVEEDEVKTARGTKQMKEKARTTIYVTTNATGTDLPPLSMIGKAKNPRCFGGTI